MGSDRGARRASYASAFDVSTSNRPTSPRSARKLTLTARGRVFLAVGVISTVTGMILGVPDLERVGVLLLALPVPAWIAVRQSRAGLRIAHAVRPTHAEVGQRVEVRLTLGNPNSFGSGPLRVTEHVPSARPLRFSVAGIRGRQRRTVAYPLPPLARGRYLVGPTEVSATDPFGLVVSDSRSGDTAELLVRPRRQPLAPLSLPMAWRDGGAMTSHSVGSGGSDDASVREFRYGDDLRKIHWRSSARTGGLMVRQEERPWHSSTLVLLDTRVTAYPPVAPRPRPDGAEDESHSGPGGSGGSDFSGGSGGSAFEWAVSAAASIGCHLAERGRQVVVVSGSGAAAHNDVDSALDLLAEVQPAHRADLGPLADALGGLGRDSSVFAILAGHDRAVIAELAVRGRTPGSAVALLLQPWTFQSARREAVDAYFGAPAANAPAGSSTALRPGHPAHADWLKMAATLRNSGWQVVPVSAGDDLAELWPQLLATSRAGR